MAIGIDNKPIIDFIFFLLSLKDIYNKNNGLYYFKYMPCFLTVLSKRKGTKKILTKKGFHHLICILFLKRQTTDIT